MKTIGKFNSLDKTLIIREDSKGNYIGELYLRENTKKGEWIGRAKFEGRDATTYRVMEHFHFSEATARIKAVMEWVIPHFGNRHIMPYGKLLVTDGTKEKICKTKGDLEYDESDYQYITFQRKRYRVINNGSLYSPALTLVPVNC